jgi:hypothetical protein
MLYVPLPVVIVSASGVGAMDLAKIGMVLIKARQQVSHAQESVEKSLDTARMSACATLN